MKYKPCITDSELFLEVSSVLGKAEALKQLLVAFRGYNVSEYDWSWNTNLFNAFYWGDTPQTFLYWERIYRKINDK